MAGLYLCGAQVNCCWSVSVWCTGELLLQLDALHVAINVYLGKSGSCSL